MARVHRFGEGNCGELFRMRDPANQPLANLPVALSLCSGRKFSSVSDAQSYAGYIAMATPYTAIVKSRFAHSAWATTSKKAAA